LELFLHRANDKAAIKRAIDLGIGIEIDIRTNGGVLYVSHDPIRIDSDVVPLGHFLAGVPKGTPILLDFKETGIIDMVTRWLPQYNLCDMDKVFAIDLIAPDMYYAQEKGLKTLARRSNYEVIDGYQDGSTREFDAGYWLDFVKDLEDLHQTMYSRTYVVSPELHRWELTDNFIRSCWQWGFAGVCTDFPERYLASDSYRNP
jgi:glycerophosphoryl diester phosphodiesterase